MNARVSGPSARSGLLVGAVLVALVTVAIYALREVAPVASTGAVYLLAVTVVAVRWGAWPALATGLLAAAAWNFFHIPPTGRFSISEGENWVAVGVLAFTAIVISRLADDARSRTHEAEQGRAEADLLADLAREMLGTSDERQARERLANRLASAFGLEPREIEIDPPSLRSDAWVLPLETDGARLGVLLLPETLPDGDRETLRRLAPSLAVLLASATRRGALEVEAVEATALRRSDEVKTALLRAVSHDLRSPLTAIRTAADGLAGSNPAAAAELADVISGESARLARLVDDLLDLSRIESGSARPSLDWCSIEEVVSAAIASLGERGAAITVALEPGLPLVEADAAQLERAVANLLDNGLRHGKGSGVSVRARKVQYRLRLEISDLGEGIPRDQLEPDLRALRDGARRQWGQRIGPGDRQGFRRGQQRQVVGRVAGRRRRHVRDRVAGQGPPEGARRGRGGRSLNQRPRVLVVDDEPQILRALRVVLGNEGFEVIAAAGAEEALDQLAVQPPDAAIIDLVLPDGDGVEITSSIREWSEMPIIVLSAVGDEAEKVRALNAGADDYVTKPFGSQELIARLRAALRRAPGGGDEARIVAGELTIDLAARRVTRRRPGGPPDSDGVLAAQLLASHRGRLITHSMLLSEVWGPAYSEDTHVLRVHIANLRSKIEPEAGRPRYITTDPGVGYRFAA